jgi:hypothetical protein
MGVLVGLAADGGGLLLVAAHSLEDFLRGLHGAGCKSLNVVVDFDADVLVANESADGFTESAGLALKQFPPLLPQLVTLMDPALNVFCI